MFVTYRQHPKVFYTEGKSYRLEKKLMFPMGWTEMCILRQDRSAANATCLHKTVVLGKAQRQYLMYFCSPPKSRPTELAWASRACTMRACIRDDSGPPPNDERGASERRRGEEQQPWRPLSRYLLPSSSSLRPEVPTYLRWLPSHWILPSSIAPLPA